ncbi:hypothetical protein [Pseudonocardia aurantiaca]|uniref:PEP-CTERM protein-sorting domain-containing protein n=1 Tax=Pseudonocardia aurantiaca TaxID=75290 RepID=A0ABW4FKW0_9PSEU
MIGVLAPGPPVAMLLGAVFTILGTVGFAWVRRRERLRWSVVYAAVQLPQAVAVSRTTRASGRS